MTESLIEQETRQVQGPKHCGELQSLRGLAALTVVLHHCLGYYAYDQGWKRIDHLILNAHAAVVLFFVLSGFVLTMSLSEKGLGPRYIAEFYGRRLFRIYPAFWVACALATAYVMLFRHIPLPGWVSEMWHPAYREIQFTPKLIIGSLVAYNNSLPLPIWSLYIELLASAAMPFIVIALGYGSVATIIVVVLAIALGFSGVALPFNAISYLPSFVFGAAMYRVIPWRKLRLHPSRMNFAIGVGGALLLWFGRHLGGWTLESSYHDPAATLIESIGAAVLIGAVFAGPGGFGMLRRSAILWLGDVSYSLYLLHLPLLGLIAGIGGEWLAVPLMVGNPLAGTVVVTVLTVVSSMAAAAISYRVIEIPSIKAGKWTVHRLSRRHAR